MQDYVVTPKQLWLDGIASTGGRVRQFVAMPMGAGYRVEAQVTGEEVTGGLQFQITLPKSHPLGRLQVLVKSLGKTIILQGFSDLATIAQLKKLIRSQVGIPTSQQRLIFCGMQLEDREYFLWLISGSCLTLQQPIPSVIMTSDR